MIAVNKCNTFTVLPGELYFGSDYSRVKTLLGSCVALTVWHPKLKVGGMCHYLLGESKQKAVRRESINAAGDFRFAENALFEMNLLMCRLANPQEFQIGLFGGGNMFAQNNPLSIGIENINYARQWLMLKKLVPVHVDVGGSVSRSLNINIATGEIHLKHYQMDTQIEHPFWRGHQEARVLPIQWVG